MSQLSCVGLDSQVGGQRPVPVGTGTSTAQAQAATYSYQRPVGCEKGLALFWLDITVAACGCVKPPVNTIRLTIYTQEALRCERHVGK